MRKPCAESRTIWMEVDVEEAKNAAADLKSITPLPRVEKLHPETE